MIELNAKRSHFVWAVTADLAVQLASDEQLEENFSAEELERLRALGYIQ